jgi:hypothetical protein
MSSLFSTTFNGAEASTTYNYEKEKGYLTVLLVCGLILGSLNGSARIPAELVAEWVVRLFSHRNATAVALIGDNLVSLSLGVILDLHGAHDVNARVQTALVKEDEPLLLGLIVQFLHVWGNVA